MVSNQYLIKTKNHAFTKIYMHRAFYRKYTPSRSYNNIFPSWYEKAKQLLTFKTVKRHFQDTKQVRFHIQKPIKISHNEANKCKKQWYKDKFYKCCINLPGYRSLESTEGLKTTAESVTERTMSCSIVVAGFGGGDDLWLIFVKPKTVWYKNSYQLSLKFNLEISG